MIKKLERIKEYQDLKVGDCFARCLLEDGKNIGYFYRVTRVSDFLKSIDAELFQYRTDDSVKIETIRKRETITIWDSDFRSFNKNDYYYRIPDKKFEQISKMMDFNFNAIKNIAQDMFVQFKDQT